MQDEILPVSFEQTHARVIDSKLSLRSLARIVAALRGASSPDGERNTLRPFYRNEKHTSLRAASSPTFKTLMRVNRAIESYEENGRNEEATVTALSAARLRVSAASVKKAREADYLAASMPRVIA